MTPPLSAVDPHLMARFRAAGGSIAWRPIPTTDPMVRARRARLHDEEARVEERDRPDERLVIVEAGPVGALVLLIELDRRPGTPSVMALPAGADEAFPQGGIRARWPREREEGTPSTVDVPIAEIVQLARYALL